MLANKVIVTLFDSAPDLADKMKSSSTMFARVVNTLHLLSCFKQRDPSTAAAVPKTKSQPAAEPKKRPAIEYVRLDATASCTIKPASTEALKTAAAHAPAPKPASTETLKTAAASSNKPGDPKVPIKKRILLRLTQCKTNMRARSDEPEGQPPKTK